MRVDGLTTAKMLAIVTLMSFNRRIKFPHGADEKISDLQQKTKLLKREVRKGISKAMFIEASKELGFSEIEAIFKKPNYLEFWNEEHEYVLEDKALEDDGTDSRIEKAPEVRFVGLREIEKENEAAE